MFCCAMFWVLVLSVAVLCAPLTKDPVELSDGVSDFRRQNLNSTVDIFVKYKKLVRAKLNKSRVESVYATVSKLMTQCYYANVDDQIEGETQGSKSTYGFPGTVLDDIPSDNGGVIDDTGTDLSKTGKGMQTENVPRKHVMTKTDVNEHKVGTKRSTEMFDAAKEVTVENEALEIEVGQESASFLRLQEVYEKKGGVCSLIYGYRNVPIYVISACRSKVTPSSALRALCEHPTSQSLGAENSIDIVRTPVQDDEGYVYRNVYCAQCNGKVNVQAWYTKLDCEDFHSLSFTDGQDKLVLMGQSASTSKDCVRQLNPAVQTMLHECFPAEYVISTSGPVHQTRVSQQSSDLSPFPLSFSILMNFGFDGKTHILFSTDETDAEERAKLCGENEIYDSQNSKCRSISCNAGYRLEERVCRKDTSYNTAEDLSDLSGMDEMVQVNLTIRNVTYNDLLLLCLADTTEWLSSELSRQLDISVDRIQNMTINVINSTNGPSSSYMEIHYYAIPFLRQGKIKKNGSQKDFSMEPGNSGNSDTDKLYSKLHSVDQKGKHLAESEGRKANSEYDDFSGVDADNVDRTKAMNRVSTYTHSSNDTGADGPEYYDVDISFDNDTDDLLYKQLNISIQISFILLPARRNISQTEKSVGNVLQYMNELTTASSFSITLNGTNLQVDNVLRAPNPSSMDDFCKFGEQQYVDSDGFTVRSIENTKGTAVTTVYVNETRKTYYPKQYDLTLVVDGIVGNLNETHETGFAFVCDFPKIADETCTGIILSRPEYTYFPNKSVLFAFRLYSFNEYEFTGEINGSIRVCAPEMWTVKKLDNNAEKVCGDDMLKISIAEAYLTYILGVISLFAMFVVLVTYSIFEKLRNLPGVNTMNLTLSIFLGELIFLVSGWIQPQQEWLCTAVAMLLHYLFLASFFWMNVMSYDVYKTFARKCILRRIRDKKYVPRYSAYAWGSPLVIVCICAFLDFSDLFDGVSVGYGGMSTISDDNENATGLNGTVPATIVHSTQGCWIQQPVASLAAFGGPLLAIILSNAVMFTRTIICIRASTSMTRKSLRNSSISHMTGHDDVMLYVRMSTVMGSTWIFGLASSAGSAFVGNPGLLECIILHVVQILFIVFNCSLGMFIFFAFVFNRRVLALYRGLVQNRACSRKRTLSASSRGTLKSQLSQNSVSIISFKKV